MPDAGPPAASVPSFESIRGKQRAKHEWRTFWRFFKYCLPYKDKVLLTVLTIFVAVPLSEIGAFLWRYQVDEIILNVEESVDRRLFMFWCVISIQVLMTSIHHLLGIMRRILGWYVDMKVTIDVRKLFYDHLHQLSLSFFRTRPVGEHMYRNLADISWGLVKMITHDTPWLIELVYRVIWSGVLLSVVDWRITFLIGLYILPYTLGAQYCYSVMQRVIRELKLYQQNVTAQLRDGIAGAKTVKGFGRERFQSLKYARWLIAERRVWLKYRLLAALTHQGVLWMLQFAMRMVLWFYIGYHTMVGDLSIGEFSIVFWLAWQFEWPLQRIIVVMADIRLSLVPAERVLETLAVPIDLVDAPDAIRMPPLRGRVEFDHVSFEYLPGRPVLKDVSFTVEPGQRVAFVGPSGAGKSTLMYLVLRLYDVSRGAVRLDGIDVRRVKMLSLQQQIGTVLQDTFLFGGSIADNIRYGKLDATDEEVRQAARLADIHDFILSLPKGYETEVGEGTKLSGGQKQRLGIARALVRNPRLVIFDEATAFLDSRAETNIVTTIRKSMAGRTCLIISHRLVTVADCDCLFVLDGGVVVDRGTHSELLSRCSLYQTLWEEQTRSAGVSREELDTSLARHRQEPGTEPV